MTEKKSWKNEVEVDLSHVKARDVAKLASASSNPAEAYDAMANMLAKIIVKAPMLEGPLNDPETYYDLPQFDSADGSISWAGLTSFVNDLMSSRLKA